jgi:dUTP pyrophosphatase
MSEEEFLRKLREAERHKRVTFVKNRLFNNGTQQSPVKKRQMINIKVDNMDFFPKCQSEGSVGYDLYSSKDMTIAPNETALIPTGVSIQLPNNIEGQIRPRSSSLLKGLLIGFGTIDCDFRGELHVVARNLNTTPFNIKRRDRFAQLCFCHILKPVLNRVENLNDTERGEEGFGSTGE